MSFDYTTVGHVTADVMADGSRRPGGSAFYSALQASRLGRRALILTRGVPEELEELLAPYRDEFELEVLEAPHTTTLETRGEGRSAHAADARLGGRDRRGVAIDTAILHLAPVARETGARWRGRARFRRADAAGARAQAGPSRARASPTVRSSSRGFPSAAMRS